MKTNFFRERTVMQIIQRAALTTHRRQLNSGLLLSSAVALTAFFYGLDQKADAAVFRVSASQTNNVADGTTWATAFPLVQEGIDAAAPGDQVWVAAGTYFENLTLKAGVALYGGFNGSESRVGERDWLSRYTILDGGHNGSVIVAAPGATNTTRVDGFIIRNGQAIRGGGIYCSNASPIIVHNFIHRNQATTGGGIACVYSAAQITFNLIEENAADQGGGGIECRTSAALIHNNRIVGNSSSVSAPTGGYQCGGGLACFGNPAPEISNNLLAGNETSPVSWIASGGLLIVGDCPARVINNTIAWNSGSSSTQEGAGGIYYYTQFPAGLTNFATFANNLICFNSSGIYCLIDMTFNNNCVFGNGTVNYAIMSDRTGVDGNISADPQLTRSLLFPSFHLSPNSPCRDAGDDSVVQPDWVDLDGGARVVGTGVDIGADEYDGALPAAVPRIVRVSPAGDDANDGSSWSKAKRTIQNAINEPAWNGSEVWVQAATYQEHLHLQHFIGLYGGFAGQELSLNQRDPRANPTVLDGAAGGTVITATNLAQWNVVDGFVIRNGVAGNGGGINCTYSSPVIADNIITNNMATNSAGAGGGIYCAAVPLATSPFTIISNLISFNRAVSGGGVYAPGNGVVILNNRFETNIAAALPTTPGAGGGGAIYIGAATVANNLFLGNIATNGCTCTSSNGVTRNAWSGGAIYISSLGGIWFGKLHAQIINNTMLENLATSECSGVPSENGGGIYTFGTGDVIENNLIVYGSSGVYAPAATFSNNCVFGNTQDYLWSSVDTNSNISVDPMLVASNDFHLTADSPCINAGDNSAVVPGWVDLDGQIRIAGGRVDIGADEYGSVLPLWLSLTGDGSQRILGLTSESSRTYVFETSDNLVNWTAFSTNQATNGMLELEVPVLSNIPNQFYRARVLP